MSESPGGPRRDVDEEAAGRQNGHRLGARHRRIFDLCHRRQVVCATSGGQAELRQDGAVGRAHLCPPRLAWESQPYRTAGGRRSLGSLTGPSHTPALQKGTDEGR